jgi:predicted cupin superfamily sugar epimerase
VTPDDIIAELGLVPHPEGGHYRETWRGDPPDGRPADGARARSAGTAIYYLLRAGERSRWHRVDAAEMWLFHAGGPLLVDTVDADGHLAREALGPDVAAGEQPQRLVPAGTWQSAVPGGAWTLVSCVVVPGFEFDGFEIAPDGWTPRDAITA